MTNHHGATIPGDKPSRWQNIQVAKHQEHIVKYVSEISETSKYARLQAEWGWERMGVGRTY